MSPPALDRLIEAAQAHLGQIVDAEGVYHDLTKGAFDAFSIKHPSLEGMHKLSHKLFRHPLGEGIAALAKKFNIDPSVYDKDNIKASASELAKWFGKKAATALGGEFAIAAATTGAATTGVGAIVGVAIETAIEWATDTWKETKETVVTYGHGEWVVIDEGQKTRKNVSKDIDIQMLENFEDGMYPVFSELHELERYEDYHVGFYVGPGMAEGTVTVFDVMSGKEEEHIITDVRPLPQDKRGLLDIDDYASRVRELYFYKHDHIALDAEVSFDPGTEVILGDYRYNIVMTEGTKALIEDVHGERQTVDAFSLKRSRQDRLGPAYIYENGKPVPNTGFVTTGAGFGRGDWCWIQRAGRWELAVVHIINGKDVVVYFATTGERLVTHPTQLRIANRDDSDTFHRIKYFTRFKIAAMEGSDDTARLKIPDMYRAIIVVDDPKPRHEYTPKVARPPNHRHHVMGAEPVKTQDLAAALDTAVETQGKYGVSTKEAVEHISEQVIEAKHETLYGTGKPLVFEEDMPAGEGTDNTAMYVVGGAVCLAGLAYYAL